MDQLVELGRYLTSENVLDRTGKPANIVDTTQHIAEAIDNLIPLLERIADALEQRP